MHKDWDELVKEEVSEELKHKTLARARQELDLNRSKHKVINFVKYLVPVLTVFGALLLYFRNASERELDGDMEVLFELSELSQEDLKDLDSELFDDLEFFEDFDTLEEWDGKSEG